MRRPTAGSLVLAVFVLAVFALAGCGSTTTTPRPSSAQSKPESMRSCLTGVIYTVKRTDRRSVNVLDPDGRLVAEVTEFGSPGAAGRFRRHLAVPGVQVGRRVAVWDTVALGDSSQRRVIAACLAKPAA